MDIHRDPPNSHIGSNHQNVQESLRDSSTIPLGKEKKNTCVSANML
jgi:hypothetical protein